MDLWIKYNQVVSTQLFWLLTGKHSIARSHAILARLLFVRTAAAPIMTVVPMSPWYVCLFLLKCFDRLVQTNSSWAATGLSKDAGILCIHGRNIESNRNARHQSTFSQALQAILCPGCFFGCILFSKHLGVENRTHLQRPKNGCFCPSSPQFCAEVASLRNYGNIPGSCLRLMIADGLYLSSSFSLGSTPQPISKTSHEHWRSRHCSQIYSQVWTAWSKRFVPILTNK